MTCNGPTKHDCIKCHDGCININNECICSENFLPPDSLFLLTCAKNNYTVSEKDDQFNLSTSYILICISILVLVSVFIVIFKSKNNCFCKWNNKREIPEEVKMNCHDNLNYDHQALEIYTENIPNIDINDLDFDNKTALGAGQFGTVYKCSWKINNLSIDVAVKLFEPKKRVNNNEQIRQMLYDELSTLEKLTNHPHVIPLLGYTLNDNVILVFPLRIDDLTKYLLAKGPDISTDLLRRYCAQIADGMIFIHSKDIIHRDLKAKNILVKDQHTVQISDFGLACSSNEQKKAAGTLVHMAYEYIVGNENVTKKGDVWAFAVTVWEIYERGQKMPYRNMLDPVNEFSLNDFLKNGKILDKPEEMPLDLWGKIRSCFAKDKSIRPTFSELYSIFTQVTLNANNSYSIRHIV